MNQKTAQSLGLEGPIISILLSLIIHLGLLGISELLPPRPPTLKPPQRTAIKLRQLGEKKSDLQEFTVPSAIRPKQQRPTAKKSGQALALDGLVPSVDPSEFTPTKKKGAGVVKKEAPKIKFSTIRPNQRQESYDEMAIADRDKEFIEDLGLNLNFKLPRGVKQDELNPAEKVLYGFQKRVFKQYVNSFLRAYYSKLKENPNLQRALLSEEHHLVGRISFDSNGNPLRFKASRVEGSIQGLDVFEETLKTMGRVSNPPEMILFENGNFELSFELRFVRSN